MVFGTKKPLPARTMKWKLPKRPFKDFLQIIGLSGQKPIVFQIPQVQCLDGIFVGGGPAYRHTSKPKVFGSLRLD